MTQAASVTSTAAPPQPMLGSDPPPPSIITRFGVVSVDRERLITLSNGLLGFARWRRFALTNVPDREVVFKLLQSVEDPELAFLVLPLDPLRGPIARADLELACQSLGIEPPSLAVLGIVTARPEAQGVRFTANLKAPLLIDSARRLGYQHVLARDSYSLHHPLGPVTDHAG
jgi:flagellar assembly factor FliW